MQTPPQPPPPTHPPPDYGKVMQLLRALMGRAPGGEISRETLEGLAKDEDVDVALVYAAAGMHPGLRFKREHPIAFGVCTGKCQMWGGFDLLAALMERADARAAAEKASFDIVPQGCLNLCEHPPALVMATPDGVAGLPRCTTEQIDEAIAMVMDAEE